MPSSDRTGMIANGLTSLTLRTSRQGFTNVMARGRNLSLSGAAAGPFTATLRIGGLTLVANGDLRAQRARLMYPRT